MTALVFLFIDVYPYFVNSQAATKHVYKERQICLHQFIYNIDIGYCRWKNGIRSWSVSQLVQKMLFCILYLFCNIKTSNTTAKFDRKEQNRALSEFFFTMEEGRVNLVKDDINEIDTSCSWICVKNLFIYIT